MLSLTAFVRTLCFSFQHLASGVPVQFGSTVLKLEAQPCFKKMKKSHFQA